MRIKVQTYLVGGLVGATVMSGAVLSMAKTAATAGTASDSKTANASVTVAATCSMTASVNTPHTGTVPNGIYSGSQGYYPNGIGKTTIQTFCNDASGYSIYAVGYTGDSMGTASNTKLHNAQLGSDYDIATGTATSGDTSQWAMKVTKVTDASTSYLPDNLSIQNSFGDFHAVPQDYMEVARYTTATDATLGSKIETTYAAYIASAQPAGTYNGKVKYTLVHPNGTEAPEIDTMQNVAYWGGALTVGEEKTVTDSRDGQSYTVARLCTNYSGTNCTSSQLWMTQNLNLQIGGYYNNQKIVLDSRNTDLNDAFEPDGTTLKTDYSVNGSIITWAPTTNGSTNSSQSSINYTLTGTPATISNFAYSGSATSVVTGWSNQNYYGYQAEGTLNGVEMYQWPGDTNAHGTLEQCIAAGYTAAVCGHYKTGNYYNWTAANAMSNSTQYATAQKTMDNSICPKGWRLPKGIESGLDSAGSEYNRLLNAQGVTAGTDTTSTNVNVGYQSGGYAKLVGAPLYFARSGYVHGTTLYYSSDSGYYWSSTIASNNVDNGYHLNFHSGGIWPARQYGRLRGFSVRCVAR